jgi:hypothetical protein
MAVASLNGHKAAFAVAQPTSRMDTDLRGHREHPRLRAEAQTDVLTVAYDGNATQHHGLQSEDVHHGPPAIVGEDEADLSGPRAISLVIIHSSSAFANGRLNKAEKKQD